MAHIKCEQRRKKTCLFPLWKLKKEGISQEGGVQNGRTTDHTMPLATTSLLLPTLDIFFSSRWFLGPRVCCKRRTWGSSGGARQVILPVDFTTAQPCDSHSTITGWWLPSRRETTNSGIIVWVESEHAQNHQLENIWTYGEGEIPQQLQSHWNILEPRPVQLPFGRLKESG